MKAQVAIQPVKFGPKGESWIENWMARNDNGDQIAFGVLQVSDNLYAAVFEIEIAHFFAGGKPDVYQMDIGEGEVFEIIHNLVQVYPAMFVDRATGDTWWQTCEGSFDAIISDFCTQERGYESIDFQEAPMDVRFHTSVALRVLIERRQDPENLVRHLKGLTKYSLH
jgi:hypothetical protein